MKSIDIWKASSTLSYWGPSQQAFIKFIGRGTPWDPKRLPRNIPATPPDSVRQKDGLSDTVGGDAKGGSKISWWDPLGPVLWFCGPLFVAIWTPWWGICFHMIFAIALFWNAKLHKFLVTLCVAAVCKWINERLHIHANVNANIPTHCFMGDLAHAKLPGSVALPIKSLLYIA